MLKTQTIIGDLIAELIGRGHSRDELAARLDVQPPTISGLKAGKGSLDDSKLAILAELHGKYSARELLALKYLEWLHREKSLNLDDLVRAQRSKTRLTRIQNAA